jgi:hypothetical protein
MAKQKLVIEHVHGELAAGVLIFSKFVLLVGLQMLVIVVYFKRCVNLFLGVHCLHLLVILF